MRLQIALGWRSLLFTTLLCAGSLAKNDSPGVYTAEFDFIPTGVQYFDDSDTMLFADGGSRTVYRSVDAGKKWEPISDVPKGKGIELVMHPHDNKRAYIIGDDKTHWMTKDKGKSWGEFKSESPASLFRNALVFHAGDPDRMIFNAMDCTGIFCEEITLYTIDGFSKPAKLLRADTDGCQWAKSTEIFETGDSEKNKERILCVVKGRFSPWRKDYRLLISDDYFQTEFEPELETGRTVQGILNMAGAAKFLVVAATAEGTDELALYVSDDSVKWHRAIFPHDHKLSEKAYTILESTKYSIQIDVMNSHPSNPMGVFLSSNSNGTYFTRNIEYTNRNVEGFVDFEKVSGIQGIVLVNTVKNGKEVADGKGKKIVVSQISFDDGRTFQSMKFDGKDLHVHNVVDIDNVGRVFSSPAPGLVMANGNTGDSLDEFGKSSLYVSDDAGENWIRALDGPHKFEFGDQGSVLVAVKDAKEVDEVSYSIDHGKKWKTVSLDKKIEPLQLTTTKDSTSLKFLLGGREPNKQDNPKGYVIVLDFEDMHEGKCKEDDMEIWYARANKEDKDAKPSCLMGHTQAYKRRKADADCFIKKEFEDPVPIIEPCDCTDADFECDFNYVRSADRKSCTLAEHAKEVVPDGSCKNSGDSFEASSGWRLIPGNDCKRGSGPQKDATTKKDCSDSVAPPASGDISNKHSSFSGKSFGNKVYLERTGVSSGLSDGQHDETVLVLTEGGVFLSHDHGKNWEQPKALKGEDIRRIWPNRYFNDVVFFLTETKKVFYSIDRGDNIRQFDAPFPPDLESFHTMSFHPKFKDSFIWTGRKDCETNDCHYVSSVTIDRGDKWETLQRYVRKCEFIKAPDRKFTKEEQAERDNLIYCDARTIEKSDTANNPMQLVSSNNFFRDREVKLDNVIDFATMSEFIVAATKDEEHQTLKASASVYGEQFADALFPHGFIVTHQKGYTVLDSSTHSVFLHVTINDEDGLQYGSIIKSNSNGTSYVLSLNAVNRDKTGYTDFEKLAGIEGVAVVNVVANYESKNYKKEGKKLKSMITHNDGAEWDYLPPPAKDAEGKKFCTGKMEKCSLNVHDYTERTDKSHTFGSKSAIGLMLAKGNVGEYLQEMKDADTFMTADGGITWKSAKKGQYMWGYGDQGSVVVLVKDDQPTKVIHYTLDEGDTWLDYTFSEKEMRIQDITTLPSDNSRNFLLWGKDDGKLVTINIDFSGLTDVKCKLDEDHVEKDDYYLWQPKHPKQDDDCLFGHVSQYHRKRTDRKCYNGKMIPHLHDISRNCSCTRQDFECDFNYERQTDGSCKLVQNFTPPDHSETCKLDDSKEEWYDVTGYRRIPLDTCQGGKELDVSIAHPCPGFEDTFGKRHGPSAWGIFFAILVPIIVAGGVGYWVWKNWANKFGQIRLGEQSSFDGEAPWVKYPIMLIAALVAVAQALPLLAASLWRSASGAFGRSRGTRFTTRDSFARGRGDYAVVDDDEGELLGDESDEEV